MFSFTLICFGRDIQKKSVKKKKKIKNMRQFVQVQEAYKLFVLSFPMFAI